MGQKTSRIHCRWPSCEFKPLVLDHGSRLYLYRYWQYQEKLTESIKSRIASPPARVGTNALKDQLERLFPSTSEGEVDWQKVAGFAATRQTFCVISGGPGTGKTTTVAKILALLVEQTSSDKLRIALTAPTGKAAARLQEAIKGAKESCHARKGSGRRYPKTLQRFIGCSAPFRVRPISGTIKRIPFWLTWWWWMKPRWWTLRSCPSCSRRCRGKLA